MQITIDIDEAEFQQAIKKAVGDTVRNYAKTYVFEHYVSGEVKKRIAAATDAIITEELANSDDIRQTVRAALENKVKHQLTRVMKADAVKI